MRANWLSLLGCLVLVAGQTALWAEEGENAAEAPAADGALAAPGDEPLVAPAKEIEPGPGGAKDPVAQENATEKKPDDKAPPETTEPESTEPVAPPKNLTPLSAPESVAFRFERPTTSGGFTAATSKTKVVATAKGRAVKTFQIGEAGVAQISNLVSGAYVIEASGAEGYAITGAYLGAPVRMEQ